MKLIGRKRTQNSEFWRFIPFLYNHTLFKIYIHNFLILGGTKRGTDKIFLHKIEKMSFHVEKPPAGESVYSCILDICLKRREKKHKYGANQLTIESHRPITIIERRVKRMHNVKLQKAWLFFLHEKGKKHVHVEEI